MSSDVMGGPDRDDPAGEPVEGIDRDDPAAEVMEEDDAGGPSVLPGRDAATPGDDVMGD